MTDGETETTKSVNTRAWWLSTVTVVVLILHYVILVSLAPTTYADLSGVPQSWWLIDSAAFTAAVAYALGPETLEAFQKLRGNGGN